LLISSILIVIFMSCSGSASAALLKVTYTPTVSRTPTASLTSTFTATATDTLTPTDTATDTPTVDLSSTPTDTPTPSETPTEMSTPTETLTPTSTPESIDPFVNAPLCSSHDNSTFHRLWNYQLGCHYDHEHGDNPFTSQVSAAFPNFDLKALLGNVEIGHLNLTSSMENTMKHGGFKWQVDLNVPCEQFESASNCVTQSVVQYHAFGNYEMEMETRNHSTASLVKICKLSDNSDCGYLFTIQHQEYGQRITPYQGTVIPYPNNPDPSYASQFGQYFSIDCVHPTIVGCRPSRQYVVDRGLNSNSIWTSKPTGTVPFVRPDGSTLFKLLFRIRDVYRLFDRSDMEYPFTFVWICSSDNGLTYNPIGCRYNNSTSRVHEIAGTIPSQWDSLDGTMDGHVTYEGFTTRFGTLNLDCLEPGIDCHPVKMVNVPIGTYGGALPGSKISNPNYISNPSRNVWFCGTSVCSETSADSVPSNWIGENN